MSLSEVQAIRILKEELSRAPQSQGRARIGVGIGDDAAVVRALRGDQLATVDSCEEGIHFLWEWMKAGDVAQKSFHSAVSDVVAMGGKPAWIVCHLSLGPRVTANWLREFARGQASCAQMVGAPVVGGNVSFSSSTSVVTTVIGQVDPGKALLRSGARPGDEVWLLGEVGLARAGLLLLERIGTRARGRGATARALRAFRAPEAQFRVGPRLVGRAHACLDVSDGIKRDAAQLALASRARVIIEAELLERALGEELLVVARQLGVPALELALQGGEDYALLATGPREMRLKQCQMIGRVERATRAREAGAFLSSEGRMLPLSGGFVHRSRE